jgi:two-component system, OmpR family, phosphate regulon sensor histidine kinase PhoR
LKFSINTYKAIAIISFLVLVTVQFFLVYNTYRLEEEHYYFDEKKIINRLYGSSIRNDKVFPGGAAIVDSFIYRHMNTLEKLNKTNKVEFNVLKQKICDSIFRRLRARNNLDSLMNYIYTSSNIKKKFNYSSTIQAIDVSFKKSNYVSLYDKNIFYPLIDSSIQTKDGIFIAGDRLLVQNAQNLLATITVSSDVDYSYRLSFSLNGEPANRYLDTLKGMLPTFLLSFFSVLSVVFIFYITFKNWLKQKKLSEMKSDFINSITHEFHTPLAAIIVANKTMQNEKFFTNKDSLLPLTQVINRQSERLKMLFSQVLHITSMNQVVLAKKECSLNHLLDEILLDYRLKLAGANVGLTLQKKAEKELVELDQFWFTTVMVNILDNAIKYNDKDYKQITVTIFNDKKNVLVSIVDNGIGMTMETQKNIFDKFFRHSKTANGVTGLGLGLYYVKQAIDAHNWKIDIQSKPGEGSNFVISMNYK